MKNKQGKRKNRTVLLLVIVAALLVAVIAALQVRRQQQAEAEASASAEIVVLPDISLGVQGQYYTYNIELDQANGITIQHVHLAWGNQRRPGEVREIRFLVIHETDNRSSGADAAAHSSFLNSDTSSYTGWHYTVDENAIYHNIPDNEIAWNAGDQRTAGGGNMNGIAIEMCVNLGSDYSKVLENTAALCAALLRQYNLTPEDVYLHADFMDKVCPHRLISEDMVYEFEDMIRADYNALMQETDSEGTQDE